MKTGWTPYWIKNELAVDFAMRIKLADLDYANDGKNRADDQGSLWVAPVVQVKGWTAPLGMLALYASTNGDPIFLGQIENGDVVWQQEGAEGEPLSDDMREVLDRADWIGDNGDGYVWTVKESIPYAK